MFDKLATEEQRYEELMRLLGTSQVQSEPQEYRKHAKALAEVEPLIERFREYKTVVQNIAETEELAGGGDADMRDLAREEMKSLVARRSSSGSPRRTPTTSTPNACARRATAVPIRPIPMMPRRFP